MKQLTIDTGIQEFEINGDGVLRFNPSDPNVYNRFFAIRDDLTALDEEVQHAAEALDAKEETDGEARAAAELALIADYDGKIKALLGEVFGTENDFDKILHGVHLMAVAGNGKRVVTNLLDALTPIIQDGAQRVMDDKADEAVQTAKLNRAQRRAAAKK